MWHLGRLVLACAAYAAAKHAPTLSPSRASGQLTKRRSRAPSAASTGARTNAYLLNQARYGVRSLGQPES
jgi:hypothetical protein